MPAEPLGVTTPKPAVVVVTPAGTVTLSVVAESTVKGAGTPPKVTEVAPVTLFPVRITTVPTGPLAGVKPVSQSWGAQPLRVAIAALLRSVTVTSQAPA